MTQRYEYEIDEFFHPFTKAAYDDIYSDMGGGIAALNEILSRRALDGWQLRVNFRPQDPYYYKNNPTGRLLLIWERPVEAKE